MKASQNWMKTWFIKLEFQRAVFKKMTTETFVETIFFKISMDKRSNILNY
jgi:hypothetical protein